MEKLDAAYQWHKIAESLAEIRNVMGSPCLVKVGGKELCVVALGERAYACAGRCPHAGGRLYQGWIDPQGRLVCPLHQYRFDMASGRNTSGEGYMVKTFPVVENEEGVFVGL